MATLVACGDDDDDTETDASADTSADAGSDDASGDPVHFGASNSTTGVASAFCSPVTDATASWFEHVNESGGANGHQIEYTVYDHEYDATKGAANVKRLVEQDGVVAIVGGCGTGGLVPVYEYAKANESLFIGPNAVIEDIVSPPKPGIFGVLPPIHLQEKAMVEWAFDEYGPGTAVTLNGLQSDILVQAVRDAVEDGGGEILEEIGTTVGQAEFGSVVLQLKDLDPDYVILESVPAADAARLIQEMERQQYKPQKRVLGHASHTDASFLSNAPAWANDLVSFAGMFVLVDDPGNAACEEALGVDTGKLTSSQQYGCAVGQIMTAAVEQVDGEVTSESLAAVLSDDSFVAEVGVFPGGKAAGGPAQLLTSDLIVYGVTDGEFEYLSEPFPIPTA